MFVNFQTATFANQVCVVQTKKIKNNILDSHIIFKISQLPSVYHDHVNQQLFKLFFAQNYWSFCYGKFMYLHSIIINYEFFRKSIYKLLLLQTPQQP